MSVFSQDVQNNNIDKYNIRLMRNNSLRSDVLIILGIKYFEGFLSLSGVHIVTNE